MTEQLKGIHSRHDCVGQKMLACIVKTKNKMEHGKKVEKPTHNTLCLWRTVLFFFFIFIFYTLSVTSAMIWTDPRQQRFHWKWWTKLFSNYSLHIFHRRNFFFSNISMLGLLYNQVATDSVENQRMGQRGNSSHVAHLIPTF